MLQFLPALLSGGASAILPTLGNILMSTAMSEVGTKLFGRDVGGLFGMMMGKDFFDVTGGADKIKNLPGIAGGADDIAKNFLPTPDTLKDLKGVTGNIGEKLMSQAPKTFSLPEVAKNAASGFGGSAPLSTLQIANVASKAGPKAGFGGLGDKWKDFAGEGGGKLATRLVEQNQRFAKEKKEWEENNPATMWLPNNLIRQA